MQWKTNDVESVFFSHILLLRLNHLEIESKICWQPTLLYEHRHHFFQYSCSWCHYTYVNAISFSPSSSSPSSLVLHLCSTGVKENNSRGTPLWGQNPGIEEDIFSSLKQTLQAVFTQRSGWAEKKRRECSSSTCTHTCCPVQFVTLRSKKNWRKGNMLIPQAAPSECQWCSDLESRSSLCADSHHRTYFTPGNR